MRHRRPVSPGSALSIERVHNLLGPLRERAEDIPILAEHFLKVFKHELNKNSDRSFAGDAVDPAIAQLARKYS